MAIPIEVTNEKRNNHCYCMQYHNKVRSSRSIEYDLFLGPYASSALPADYGTDYTGSICIH